MGIVVCVQTARWRLLLFAEQFIIAGLLNMVVFAGCFSGFACPAKFKSDFS